MKQVWSWAFIWLAANSLERKVLWTFELLYMSHCLHLDSGEFTCQLILKSFYPCKSYWADTSYGQLWKVTLTLALGDFYATHHLNLVNIPENLFQNPTMHVWAIKQWPCHSQSYTHHLKLSENTCQLISKSFDSCRSYWVGMRYWHLTEVTLTFALWALNSTHYLYLHNVFQNSSILV